MTQDWTAVAKTIEEHMIRLGLSQRQLAARSGVGVSTVNELRRNLIQRRRDGRILEAISRALDLHPGHLSAVASGHPPLPSPKTPTVPVADVSRYLDRIEVRLSKIAVQTSALNAKVAMITDSLNLPTQSSSHSPSA